jgi:sulfite reductase (ferredoxin)
MPGFKIVDHTGWHAQGDGRFYYGLSISSGRIKDQGKFRLRTALRRIVEELEPTPILTPTQDVLLADLPADARAKVEAILTEHGVALPGTLSEVARWALACPAAGIANERISVRITGCPNGCARPYAGEIGIVGRTAADYAVFLGGDFEGTRLNRRVFDRVKLAEIASTLAPIFAAYAAERGPDERFGDWCHAQSDDRLRDLGRKLAA